MKKVISFFLLVVTILSIGCLPVFANELTVLDMEQYLINQGIPQSYLDSLIEEEIQNLYSDLCDKKICYQGTQIIKGLSESHSPDQIQPLGTIGSDYLTLSLTYISNIEYDSSVKKNRIIETYVYLNYHWTKLPAISRQDPIAINWDPSVFTFKSNSFNHKDYGYYDYNNSWKVDHETTTPTLLEQCGMGYLADISALSGRGHSGAVYPSDVKGTTEFTLLPQSRMYQDNGQNTTSINVNCTHNKDPFGWFNPSFSVSGVGININFAGFKDSMAISKNFYYSR